MSDLAVGCFVIPEGASDDPDNTHALEGTVWAVEQMLDRDTGELADHLHVVRDRHGRELVFTMWAAARAEGMSPTDEYTIDRILKICGKKLIADGRKTDERVFAVVHALGAYSKRMPQREVASIFDHGLTIPEDEEAGWERRPASVPESGKMTASMVGKLSDRLSVLDKIDHQALNEIRREAREQGLVYLEDAAVMPLADIAKYDTILRRWEKHQARKQTAS